jgi:hypothetical protein
MGAKYMTNKVRTLLNAEFSRKSTRGEAISTIGVIDHISLLPN